jgi:hypothetical protein
VVSIEACSSATTGKLPPVELNSHVIKMRTGTENRTSR